MPIYIRLINLGLHLSESLSQTPFVELGDAKYGADITSSNSLPRLPKSNEPQKNQIISKYQGIVSILNTSDKSII